MSVDKTIFAVQVIIFRKLKKKQQQQTKIKVIKILLCSCDADLRVAIAGWISSSAKMLG